MKISASIYSSKEKSLSELVKELDEFHVDYFHVDCNDDLKVFEDIKTIRKQSKTPIDLHIISSASEKFFQKIIENEIELVTFQYENLKNEIIIPQEIKSQLGLAIVSETEIDVFEKYKDRFDFILFMTTTPGKSGGTFNKENFKKIREFHQKYPEKKIHVDGGVTDKNPIRVYDDFTITEMIEFIKNTKQNILYLPVVDRKNNLTGAITFTNLIKGE